MATLDEVSDTRLRNQFDSITQLLQGSYAEGIPNEVHPWYALACQIYKTTPPPVDMSLPALKRPRTVQTEVENIHVMKDFTIKGTTCCVICGTTEERFHKLAQKGEYIPECKPDYKIYNRFTLFKHSLIDYAILQQILAKDANIDIKTIYKHLLLAPIPDTWIQLRTLGVTYGFEKGTGVVDCIYVGKQRKFGAISVRTHEQYLDIHLGMNGWKGALHHFHLPSFRDAHKNFVTVDPKDVRWHDRTFMGRILEFCTYEVKNSFNQLLYWYHTPTNKFVLEAEYPDIQFKYLMKDKDLEWGERDVVAKDKEFLFYPKMDSYELGLHIMKTLPPELHMYGLDQIDPFMVSQVIRVLVQVLHRVATTAIYGHSDDFDTILIHPKLNDYHKFIATYFIDWGKKVIAYWAGRPPPVPQPVVIKHPLHPQTNFFTGSFPKIEAHKRLHPAFRKRYILDELPEISNQYVQRIVHHKEHRYDISDDKYVQMCHHAFRSTRQLILEKWASPIDGVKFDHIKFATQGVKGDSEIYVHHLTTGWSRVVNRGDFIGHIFEKPVAVHGPIKIIGCQLTEQDLRDFDTFYMKMDGSQGKIKVIRYHDMYAAIFSSKDSPTICFYDLDGNKVPEYDHAKTMITYCQEDTNINLRKSGYVVKQLYTLIQGKDQLELLANMGVTLHCEVIGIQEKLQIIYNDNANPHDSVFVYGANDTRGNPIPFHEVEEHIAKPLGFKFVRSFKADLKPLRNVGLFVLFEGVVARRTIAREETFENMIRCGSSKEKLPFFQLAHYLRRSLCDIATGKWTTHYYIICGIIGLFHKYVGVEIVNRMVVFGMLFIRSYMNIVKFETPTEITMIHAHRFKAFKEFVFPKLFFEPEFRVFDQQVPVELGFTDEQLHAASLIVDRYPPAIYYNYCKHLPQYVAYHKDIASPIFGHICPTSWMSEYMLKKHTEMLLHTLRSCDNIIPQMDGYVRVDELPKIFTKSMVQSLITMDKEQRMEYKSLHRGDYVRAKSHWLESTGINPKIAMTKTVITIPTQFICYGEYAYTQDPLKKGTYKIISYTGPVYVATTTPPTYLIEDMDKIQSVRDCTSNFKPLTPSLRPNLPIDEVLNLLHIEKRKSDCCLTSAKRKRT